MRAARSLLLAALAATATLAGCLGDEVAPAATELPPAPAPPAPGARAVVALVDSGINVYHEHFRANASLTDEELAAFANALDGALPERVNLTTEGDFEARLEADEDVWGALERQKLYYFEGTRVLGISFSSDEGDENPILDAPDGSHGTATAGAVLAANPDAIVVMVEGISADSEAWAAMQPWIDLVSMSYGPIGSIPGTGAVFGLTTHEATRLMWQSGKVPVGAADNTPATAPSDETAGPPWVVGVAGDHSEQGCREHASGTAPDFTSDFTQNLPLADSIDEYGDTSGTSFATPKTAGTMSLVLQQARAAWNQTGGAPEAGALALRPDGTPFTHADLREAFNLTARYLDFNPTCVAGPVNPLAPWMQQGWGHVGPEIAPAALAHVLGTEAAPAKAGPAVAFQQALHDARRLYWDNAP